MNQREQVGVPKLLIYDAAGNVVEHILTCSRSPTGVLKGQSRAP